MRVRSMVIKGFKRFSDLEIEDIPESARLVVMVGPNGCGKSSLFDAFRMWHLFNGGFGSKDEKYHLKQGLPPRQWQQLVHIDFHDLAPTDSDGRKKIFYIRSAYRNDADFSMSHLQRMGPALDSPKIARLIDNDSVVGDNYQRLVSATIAGVYTRQYDSTTVAELRDRFIGPIRDSMKRVFDGLLLHGPGDPLQEGSFFFEKGISTDFHYKNLSGGEKAAFDILLDIIVKRDAYNNTVYCIDEPEGHMHTRLQAALLEELYELIPPQSQLWIATHSIGMMRKARDLQAEHPNAVVFLDFHDLNFDERVTMRPQLVNREFWCKTLNVALDDLASLVAPRRVVLCEGRPVADGDPARAELDAYCYRQVFSREYPDTDFVSVGNADDVQTDRLRVGSAIKRLVEGTSVVHLVDRDDRSDQELQQLAGQGIRVLSRRHLESYLMDDEIITKLCEATDQVNKLNEILEAKRVALEASRNRGNPGDDVKSAAGQIYNSLKRILNLTGCGNTVHAFLRDTLAPLVTPDTTVYAELKQDIMGDADMPLVPQTADHATMHN